MLFIVDTCFLRTTRFISHAFVRQYNYFLVAVGNMESSEDHCDFAVWIKMYIDTQFEFLSLKYLFAACTY